MLNELFSLKGRTSVVTGGTGHLGTAITEVLAECGSDVVVVSRKSEKQYDSLHILNEKFGDQIKYKVMNVGSTESIKECVNQIIIEQKTIDVWVNNAYFGEEGSNEIEFISDETWISAIDGSINSVFKCTREVIPIMKKANYGTIINIASMYGVVSPNPDLYVGTEFTNPPNYGAGKAAVIQFTRFAACHLGKYGIRVNSISPGPFPNKDVQNNKQFIERLAEKTSLKRIGKPHELKGIVALLASDASSYITGANFAVDGGWTAW